MWESSSGSPSWRPWGRFPGACTGTYFGKASCPRPSSACSARSASHVRTLQYKAQYETAQARLSSLESRLRPHFLFNTLNSIMALIPEDAEAAERMTERLAALLRYSLDATEQRTVTLGQEVKVATDYLEIEKARFGDRCKYSIDVPEELMREEVPPFSLQTLVENSVKYGGSEVRVSARQENHRLVLRVWDSGDGFPDQVDLPNGHGLTQPQGTDSTPCGEQRRQSSFFARVQGRLSRSPCLLLHDDRQESFAGVPRR